MIGIEDIALYQCANKIKLVECLTVVTEKKIIDLSPTYPNIQTIHWKNKQNFT